MEVPARNREAVATWIKSEPVEVHRLPYEGVLLQTVGHSVGGNIAPRREIRRLAKAKVAKAKVAVAKEAKAKVAKAKVATKPAALIIGFLEREYA